MPEDFNRKPVPDISILTTRETRFPPAAEMPIIKPTVSIRTWRIWKSLIKRKGLKLQAEQNLLEATRWTSKFNNSNTTRCKTPITSSSSNRMTNNSNMLRCNKPTWCNNSNSNSFNKSSTTMNKDNSNRWWWTNSNSNTSSSKERESKSKKKWMMEKTTRTAMNMGNKRMMVSNKKRRKKMRKEKRWMKKNRIAWCKSSICNISSKCSSSRWKWRMKVTMEKWMMNSNEWKRFEEERK